MLAAAFSVVVMTPCSTGSARSAAARTAACSPARGSMTRPGSPSGSRATPWSRVRDSSSLRGVGSDGQQVGRGPAGAGVEVGGTDELGAGSAAGQQLPCAIAARDGVAAGAARPVDEPGQMTARRAHPHLDGLDGQVAGAQTG